MRRMGGCQVIQSSQVQTNAKNGRVVAEPRVQVLREPVERLPERAVHPRRDARGSITQRPAEAAGNDGAHEVPVVDGRTPHALVPAEGLVGVPSDEHELPDGRGERRTADSPEERDGEERVLAPRNERNNQALGPRVHFLA
jgi:hypothetical protein